MAAAFGSDEAVQSSASESDRMVVKKVLCGGGAGVGGGVVKVEEGEGSGVITHCAQFPIVSFDRKNKGLTSIIENLSLKVRHQKGEFQAEKDLLAVFGCPLDSLWARKICIKYQNEKYDLLQ